MVIGCDTVVDVDGAVFGKPADRDDARRMIRVPAGRGHLVHTGVIAAQDGAVLRRNHKSVFDALSDAGDRGVNCDRRPLRQGQGLRRAEQRGKFGGYRAAYFN